MEWNVKEKFQIGSKKNNSSTRRRKRRRTVTFCHHTQHSKKTHNGEEDNMEEQRWKKYILKIRWPSGDAKKFAQTSFKSFFFIQIPSALLFCNVDKKKIGVVRRDMREKRSLSKNLVYSSVTTMMLMHAFILHVFLICFHTHICTSQWDPLSHSLTEEVMLCCNQRPTHGHNNNNNNSMRTITHCQHQQQLKYTH